MFERDTRQTRLIRWLILCVAWIAGALGMYIHFMYARDNTHPLLQPAWVGAALLWWGSTVRMYQIYTQKE